MTLPRWDSVAALYWRQKSMMLTPWGPSAVPTGGAGVAAPACSCTLTSAAIFFFGGIACVSSFWVVRRGHREPDRLCHLGCCCTTCDYWCPTVLVLKRAGQPHHS